MILDPENAKVKIAAPKWILGSRVAELFFATGIPVTGFALAAKNVATLDNFIWFYPVTLLAGWHVLAVNDLFFSDKNFPGRDKLLSTAFFLPIFFVPVVVALILLQIGNGSFVAAIVLTVINWDIYSVWGKRRWLSGLLHNSLAGAFHFSIGLTAVGCPIFCEFRAETIFFALAMSGAVMHHDASHSVEDSMRKYKTGAVVFGRERWWKLAVVPMFFCLQTLFYCEKLFSMVFTFSLIVYSISYIIFIFLSSYGDPARRYSLFRGLCRAIFALGGLVFIALSILRLLQL